MKPYLSILFFVILVALTGCRDDSYRGYEEDFSVYSPSMAVMVAVGDPSLTKGTGPIDYLEDFTGKEVNVWAFSRDSLADYTYTRSRDSLTCLVDGFPALLDGMNSVTKWKDNARFYYPKLELSTNKYDFFAAFLDDAEFSTRRSTDRIELDVKIDGSQDLLISKARLPLNKIGNVKEYAFSYLSAAEGDIPIFTMHHQLVRLDVMIKPGISVSKVSRVVVCNASLLSRTDAVMTVAAKDSSELKTIFREDSPYANLALSEDDGSELRPDTLDVIQGDPMIDSTQALQLERTHRLGAGFFVSPENSYILTITLHEPDHQEGYVDREPIENLVRLKAADKSFLAGNHYVVTMTIYGERDIFYNVTLQPWSNGGGFIIDPDQDSELIEMTIAADDQTLHVGESAQLSPKVILSTNGSGVPQDRDDVSYEFESCDPSLVSVSEEGEVKALAVGETYVIIRASREALGSLDAGVGVKAIKVNVIE